MEEMDQGERQDEPVESGALEDEGEGATVREPPQRDEPVESGALEDEQGGD
jgi:hypothetical protein